MKKFISIILLSFIFSNSVFSQTKQGEDVFGRWIAIQQVFKRVDVADMKYELTDNNINILKVNYDNMFDYIRSFYLFYNILSEHDFSKFFSQIKFPKDEQFKEKFNEFYSLLKSGVSNFVEYLKNSGFASKELNAQEEKINTSLLIEKHKKLFESMFFQKNIFKMQEYLFTVANDFFDYCFSTKTFDQFKILLLEKKFHPIIRFLSSIIWYNLASQGWKQWHQNCLDNLKKQAQSGKEIVYIAGGSDIYQLLKNGIYNITIIDPQLPSQPKYYTNDWFWLVKGEGSNGGIGDRLELAFPDKKIVLKRESFKEFDDTFFAQLSTGYDVNIAKSITKWGVYDEHNKRVGTYTLDRRYLEQEDLNYNEKKVFLISFNELYFITLPKNKGGWGINTYKFDSKLNLYVKQLNNIVSSQMSKNLRISFEEGKDFNYIALGTRVT